MVTWRILALLDWTRHINQRDWIIPDYPLIDIHDSSVLRLRKSHVWHMGCGAEPREGWLFHPRRFKGNISSWRCKSMYSFDDSSILCSLCLSQMPRTGWWHTAWGADIRIMGRYPCMFGSNVVQVDGNTFKTIWCNMLYMYVGCSYSSEYKRGSIKISTFDGVNQNFIFDSWKINSWLNVMFHFCFSLASPERMPMQPCSATLR